MKRIMNDIALANVISLLPGFTNVIIENRKASEVFVDNSPNVHKWKGMVKDIYTASDEIRYKWMKTKIHEIRPLPGGYVLLVISTQYDNY